MAVGYLLTTTATSGFPESCLFFQASGHYITPRFLGRRRVLVWGEGNQPGGVVASVTPKPNHSSGSPGVHFPAGGETIQTQSKGPEADPEEPCS